MAENDSLPPELTLLVPLRDVVHLWKSLKCSCSNWFIDLDGEKSNLVLVRCLRDSADASMRKVLRNCFPLECVRNKDRMAVEPIVRLTCPDVLNVLGKVTFVDHTIVPEKYRLWNTNLPGVCSRLVAVSPGPPGTVIALDYDFDKCTSKRVKIRLH